MTSALRLASVALASYAVASAMASILIGAAWRLGMRPDDTAAPAARARRLVWLRAVPSMIGLWATFGVVLPAYVAFEPRRAYEDVGPALLTLAAAGVAIIAAALLKTVRLALATWGAQRACLRASAALVTTPPAGFPAFVVDDPAAGVALVGVFRPTLMAARCVVNACTEAELACIVAHERRHLLARDNVTRWIMACAPDPLRWTSRHREIATAWHDAAEDAADDAATGGHPMARVDLAALLLKVAQLAPPSGWAVPVSPFVEADRLDRRVRRLLADAPAVEPTHRPAVSVIVAAALAVLVALLGVTTTLESVHAVVEALVGAGR